MDSAFPAAYTCTKWAYELELWSLTLVKIIKVQNC